MVKGIYVPVEPSAGLEVREFVGVEALQAAVDGWIEAVDIPALGVTIYVNEEGLIRRLSFNYRASFLWWVHVPASRQQMLVGDAVILRAPAPDGSTTDVPRELVDLLTVDAQFAVVVKVATDAAAFADPLNVLSSVAMPLVSGEPGWFVSSARYEDYFSAAVWAMVLLERWERAIEVDVVPESKIPPSLR